MPEILPALSYRVLTMFPPSPQFGGQRGAGLCRGARIGLIVAAAIKKTAVKMNCFMRFMISP